MRKTIMLMSAIFILCAFVFPEIKIGVINPQKIMDNTKKGLAIQDKLEKFQKQKQQQLQTMQEEIKKLEKDLLSPALNNEAREKKNIEAQEKQKAFKRFYEDAQNEFQRESQKELMTLEKDLMPLVDNLGRQKGFTIIFDITRPGIVYFYQTIDITDEVIKMVDAKYSK